MLKTYGCDRCRLVPPEPGTNPKVCIRCDLWFAAHKRQKICTGCSPAKTRTQRAIRYNHTRTHSSAPKTAGQSTKKNGMEAVYSEYLNLTFQTPRTDPRAKTLLCRVLAYEEAAKQNDKERKKQEKENQTT